VNRIVDHSHDTKILAAMFFPKDNPGYYALSEDAKKYILEWTMNDWYNSSTGETTQLAIEHEL
jgi:hypothetical protein